MSKCQIEYKGSIHSQAGWRSVYFKAIAEKLSEKRVKVLEITSIDDEPVRSQMSRTGANRQKYNGEYFAEAEVGKIKNVSALLSCVDYIEATVSLHLKSPNFEQEI